MKKLLFAACLADNCIPAPTTMNNHYTSLVNHDMHAGGW